MMDVYRLALKVGTTVMSSHAFELVLAYIYTDRIYLAKSPQEPRSNEVTLVMIDVYRLALKVGTTVMSPHAFELVLAYIYTYRIYQGKESPRT